MRDAIKSLRAQTHTDYEHVIMDGGFTDSTLPLLEGSVTKNLRKVGQFV